MAGWLDGWDPIVHDLVRATPEDRLVDYKLVFRDPLPTFVSPKARIALIGDAAHPFLPTSIQGASQSMGDGVTLAVCLEKSGKSKISQAIRAYEAIRYERVHKVQKTGVTTREQWHKADWDKIRKDPKSLHLKREAWLLDFDAESHAYQVFDDVVRQLTKAPLSCTQMATPSRNQRACRQRRYHKLHERLPGFKMTENSGYRHVTTPTTALPPWYGITCFENLFRNTWSCRLNTGRQPSCDRSVNRTPPLGS